MYRTLIALAGICASSAAVAAPLQVYFNDLDGGETFAAGVTGSLSDPVGTVIVPVEGFAGLGAVGNQFGGNFARNLSATQPGSSLTLQLNGLPAHDSIDLDFLFAAIDSWDSTDGSVSPDLFEVLVDSVIVATATFATASGTITTAFGTDIGGGAVHRGFNGAWPDRAFDTASFAALTVAHNAASATIEFRSNGAGWQGGTDESWAIDNLTATVNTVPVVTTPEPAALALALGGIAGIAALRRRG